MSVDRFYARPDPLEPYAVGQLLVADFYIGPEPCNYKFVEVVHAYSTTGRPYYYTVRLPSGELQPIVYSRLRPVDELFTARE